MLAEGLGLSVGDDDGVKEAEMNGPARLKDVQTIYRDATLGGCAGPVF